MTGRAILWCGFIRRKAERLEFAAFRNDIELAHVSAVRRGVNPRDVWALVCDRELLPQNFAGTWMEPDAGALDRVTRDIARVAAPGDGFLFIATNHCEEDEGLLTASGPPDEFSDDAAEATHVTPGLLQTCLDRIPGQQIVLVATCHAGMFLPLGNDRRTVLTSCGNDDKDYTHTATLPPRSLFLSEVTSHWAGTSLNNDEPPEARPLAEAFAHAREQCPGAQCRGGGMWS